MTSTSTDTYGTALVCDALSAYRRDLERTPDVVRFGDDDSKWLQLALRVEQATAPTRRPLRPGAMLARHTVLRPRPLLAAAEKMEAAGALTLAYTILAAARRVWDNADPANAGSAVFRQARICRTLGATQAAENHYSFLFSFATRHRLPELRGRALVGKGIIRTLEGDAESAYRWYAKARAASGRDPVVIAVSYHGEMAAALAEEDFNHALVAGWRALETGALGSYDRAGVMVNMASISLRAGQSNAALRSVLSALQATSHARVRLIAYSKGALAAAQLGRTALVEKFASRLVATAASANFPLDELESRSELAVALARVGETTRARRLARSVRREAVQLELGVVIRRCDSVLADVDLVEPRLELSAPARRVVLELEAA